MPRIVFVAPSAYAFGGVQTWLSYLLPGLAARGWHALLALASGDLHDARAYVLANPGLETVTIDNRTGSGEGRLRAMAGMIERTAPDLVAGVNIPDTYATVARMRKAGTPAPRVAMTLHGIQPDLFDDVQAYRHVLDGLVCTNALSAAIAEAHGLPKDRLYYAPYGVETPPKFAQAPAYPVLKLAHVGRIEDWQKRVSDLVGIADRLASRGVAFELSVAGSGPAESALRQQMQSHVDAGRVRFLGLLDAATLDREIYAQSHVLLLTSSWETGPIVIWEAMARGIAVASSAYVGAGLEGALRHESNCLLFPVGDVEAAAACVERLVNPALREQLGRAAFDLVARRYSRPVSIDAWHQALSNVLAAPSAGHEVAQQPAARSGRLDRWLGSSLGETVRSALGIRFRHRDAGGEWPHAHGFRHEDDAAFWAQARQLDRWSRPQGSAGA